VNYAPLLIFPSVVAAAAVWDLLTLTIPNKLVLAMIGVFPVVLYLAGLPLSALGLHAAAGAGVLVVCFGLFAVNLVGGGDAKLAAATALWLGPSALLTWVLWVGVFGGLLAVMVVCMRRIPLSAGLADGTWLGRLHDRENGIPYGIAMAAAAVLIYPATELFAALSR